LARGPQYNLPFRRRREGRTDYDTRKKLITSRAPRLVVRPSLKHIVVQVIEARPDGDHVVTAAHSSELREFGWKAPCGNMSSAYLTGLLAGKRAKAAGITEVILDIGTHAKRLGSRIFATAKGALDAGLQVPHDKSALPAPERIQGKHVASYSKTLAADPERYRRTFSAYLKQKLKPETLPEHFAEVEAKIKAG